MAFVTDSFTDTDSTILQSHTGETGATWTEHPNESGTDAKIISNAAKKDSAGAVSYYASGTPATNEYDVEVVCGFTTSSGVGAGCSGRLLTTANTGYLAWGSSNTVLYKLTAGTFGSIGAYASVWSSGTVVKLEIRTAAKSVYLDGGGTPVITNGDDTHTGAGRAGLRFYGTGGILESFSATDSTSDLTVNCTLGTATADGFTASVDRQLVVTGTLGTATASGFDAQVDRQLTIAGLLGTAIGDGFLADITIGSDLNISGILGVATADGFNANIDQQISISGSLGQALADGFLANVDLQYTVSGILGTADASGYSASIDRQYAVTGILGTATADGLLAGIDLQYTVSCTLGTATADGYTASVVVAGPSIYNIVYKSAEFTTSLSKSAEFTVSAANRTLRF